MLRTVPSLNLPDLASYQVHPTANSVSMRGLGGQRALVMQDGVPINDSGNFRLVLTPKNDPISHKDHFHIEANPDYSELADDKPKS